MFGADVYRRLKVQGHDVVGVYTVPDANGKADPLAVAAEKDGVPVFKLPKWRRKVNGKFEVINTNNLFTLLTILPIVFKFHVDVSFHYLIAF